MDAHRRTGATTSPTDPDQSTSKISELDTAVRTATSGRPSSSRLTLTHDIQKPNGGADGERVVLGGRPHAGVCPHPFARTALSNSLDLDACDHCHLGIAERSALDVNGVRVPEASHM